MDGEKDPRNLLLLFNVVHIIIKHLDFESYTEDIFDTVFCYFPITFKPPPNDPYGITAEDLKHALRRCVAGSPVFAQHALPMLMEKLSSTMGSAKKDAMETMTACTDIYFPEDFVSISSKLWDYLKEEVGATFDHFLDDRRP